MGALRGVVFFWVLRIKGDRVWGGGDKPPLQKISELFCLECYIPVHFYASCETLSPQIEQF